MVAIRKKFRDDAGKVVSGTLVEVTDARETYSRISLEDGTVIRVRPVIVEVVRLDEKDEHGQPTYKIDGQLVVSIHHPTDQSEDEEKETAR